MNAEELEWEYAGERRSIDQLLTGFHFSVYPVPIKKHCNGFVFSTYCAEFLFYPPSK